MFQGPLYISSDHAGFQLKKRLVRFIEKELQLRVTDMGANEQNTEDNFTDYVIPAAKKAVETGGRAIMICGSGIGSCIAANKVKGMYAALAYNIESSALARQHNDANGLCLAGRVLSEAHAMAMVKKWLETDFLGDKYEQRNKKIRELEQE